ncbi:cyclic lactone autoinducer peptide [Brevibacterium sp. JNUCC-42]|nr:cyclic lactone autoinducer peptide [Brevibacterium sp. JNUCC-42]
MSKIAKYSSVFLSAVALFVVSAASPWFTHSPEAPKELLKK